MKPVGKLYEETEKRQAGASHEMTSGYMIRMPLLVTILTILHQHVDSSLPARRRLLEYNLCRRAFRMTNGVCDLGAFSRSIRIANLLNKSSKLLFPNDTSLFPNAISSFPTRTNAFLNGHSGFPKHTSLLPKPINSFPIGISSFPAGACSFPDGIG